MAVSRKPKPISTGQRLTRLFQSVSRYDLLLAAVPLGFVLSLIGHVVAGVPIRIAIAGGALVGLLVLVDALFVHPPSSEPPRTTQ